MPRLKLLSLDIIMGLPVHVVWLGNLQRARRCAQPTPMQMGPQEYLTQQGASHSNQGC